ncbi:MAG: hypothetical protein ALECFALPRED_010033 [Alectoria fallacina]|uniref:Uncharacterized protein n=1 Tax=Alectoria fallacina TaxID=1903189 RepID=A0A8H3IC08_9LECA|nr:MAG: hypothetical protein ALECFALPRED_010033 [Alectoria fallacina]
MLISSPKYLAPFLTFFALILVFLTRRHVIQDFPRQRATEYIYENSDQTVIGGGLTELQETTVYDKLSGDTPSDIEANWLATLGAKSLLQKVQEFRDRTQASYNDDSRKSVYQTLEYAKLELENVGKQPFNTKKIAQGVQKLKVALKAAEEVIARGPEPKTMVSKSTDGGTAATQLEEAFQKTEVDRKCKEKAAALAQLQKAELDAVIAESKEGPNFH